MIMLISLGFLAPNVSGLISQNEKAWYWTSDTTVTAVATGDVDGDGVVEVVAVGYSNDGAHWSAQLSVWDPATLTLERSVSWRWGTDTKISSVAVASISGGTGMEIVTGGSYFDGTRWNAQLCVWNGATLALENVRGWFWTSDTEISSVAVGSVNSAALSIVTGGSYFDGTIWSAQLCVWDSVSLTLQSVKTWSWASNTYINSVAILSSGTFSTTSIVTGGSYFDGTRLNSQLCVFSNALNLNSVTSWYWTGNTEITSIAVISSRPARIVTGGYYNDGTRDNAQLIIWDAVTLAAQNTAGWYKSSNTRITSIAVGTYSGTGIDIITCGQYNDGAKNHAQLIDWNSAGLTSNSATNWLASSGTVANSVALGNFGLGNRIAVGGSYFDSTRDNAQITIWG